MFGSKNSRCPYTRKPCEHAPSFVEAEGQSQARLHCYLLGVALEENHGKVAVVDIMSKLEITCRREIAELVTAGEVEVKAVSFSRSLMNACSRQL